MKYVIWGASQLARVTDECMRHTDHELVALFDNREVEDSPLESVPCYRGKDGFEEWKKSTGAGEVGALVSIGSHNKARVEIQEFLADQGLQVLKAVHPTAFVAQDAIIGEGSHVYAKAVVHVYSRLGQGVIVNTGATVDHNCVIGDGVHICPGVHLSGSVVIENFAMLYTGAVVMPGVRIGEGAVIGAGSVVGRDIPPYTVVSGNPARLIRKVGEDL